MNDGELVVHTICSLKNYAKNVMSTGRSLESDELSTLWETFRIALFPHLSPDYLANKFQEVEEADKNMSRVSQQVVKASGNEGEIIP
jgi:hypothetical protein